MKPPAARSVMTTLGVALIAGIGLVGCSSGGDEPVDFVGAPVEGTAGDLSEVDRRVLDESVAPGHGDLVAAAADDPEVCGALAGAVEASKALDAASGEELVALLAPSQAPMDKAATVLSAKGFTLTAEHYGRYRDALAATEGDIDMSDQASRDRANQRFEQVQALGAGSTATELGGLAVVCGVS
ncbi:MAG: hypothetical protein M9922_03810 [Microthrixaceae bacterium]|nr:hypothetical protein [Microthrixaceae bacterium]